MDNDAPRPPNGAAPAEDPRAVAHQQLRQIQEPVRMVVGTTIRGLLVSVPGVPADVLLNAIAWQVGNLLGSSLEGDLAVMLRLRNGFKAAFEDGVNKAKIVSPKMNG